MWTSITDLPANKDDFISPELPNLSTIWIEQSEKLEQSGAVSTFNEGLKREWAIETGIIEDLYSIERGVTQLLIKRGIEVSLIPHGATDRPAQEVVAVIKDHESVLDGLFDFVKGSRPLSTSYIKELHSSFTRSQKCVVAQTPDGESIEVKLLRGEWKKHPNNPKRKDGSVHQYCPPEHVSSEMDELINMHHQHECDNVPPEIEAAWLHHRFVQIHPFQDGNGRVARALASLVFIKARHFPLVVGRDLREEYLDALEKADAGDLRFLIELFARQQKAAFIKALSISNDAIEEQAHIKEAQIIDAALDKLKSRKHEHEAYIKSALDSITSDLRNCLEEKLKETSSEMEPQLKEIDPHYCVSVWRSGENDDFWFKRQIIAIANDMGYYANLGIYKSWVRMRIKEERETSLLFSFHGLGYEFSGVLVASAIIEQKGKSEDGDEALGPPKALCREVFQYSYLDKAEPTVERFKQWLNEATLFGLDEWRRNL